MTSFQYNVGPDQIGMNRRGTNFVSPWPESESLSEHVQEAVAEADWNRIGPMGLPFPKSERNATFLGILTYCYALGLYPTRDIIHTLVKDKGGPALALMGLNAASLRRFRRGFRPLLAQCLAAVLAASAQNAGTASDRWMARTPTMSSETFAAEAERRIGVAVEWDGDVLDRVRA